MTPGDFRRLALALDGVVEAEHMGHPDFRVGGRIFATLQPGMRTGMVTLSLEDQARFIEEASEVFSAEAGAWGAGGSTRVQLGPAGEEIVGEAITLAWQLRRAKNDASGRKAKTAMKRKATKRR